MLSEDVQRHLDDDIDVIIFKYPVDGYLSYG